jgi:hypothetical protein
MRHPLGRIGPLRFGVAMVLSWQIPVHETRRTPEPHTPFDFAHREQGKRMNADARESSSLRHDMSAADISSMRHGATAWLT